MAAMGDVPDMTGQEMAMSARPVGPFIKSEIAKWSEIAKKIDLKPPE